MAPSLPLPTLPPAQHHSRHSPRLPLRQSPSPSPIPLSSGIANTVSSNSTSSIAPNRGSGGGTSGGGVRECSATREWERQPELGQDAEFQIPTATPCDAEGGEEGLGGADGEGDGWVEGGGEGLELDASCCVFRELWDLVFSSFLHSSSAFSSPFSLHSSSFSFHPPTGSLYSPTGSLYSRCSLCSQRIQNLPQSIFKKLYQEPCTTLALFRRMLPNLAKSVVMAMLYNEEAVPLSFINAWVRPGSRRYVCLIPFPDSSKEDGVQGKEKSILLTLT